MKQKIVSFFALATVIASLAGCTVVLSTGPMANEAARGFQYPRLVITNASGLWGQVIAYDKQLAIIGPGDSFTAQRHVHPDQGQTPILVRFFDGPDLVGYRGSAGMILADTQEVTSWIIREADIHFAPGANERGRTSAHASQTLGKSLPWRPGLGVIQIVNHGLLPVIVRVSGSERATLEPNGLYCLKGALTQRLDLEVTLTQVDACRHNKGIANRRIGFESYQWIVEESDFR